jgi:hypothetical protein
MSTVVHASPAIAEANYRRPEEEPDAALRDNPMALVFPAPLSPEEMYDRLTVDPPVRDAAFRNQTLEVRLEGTDQLDEPYTPFPHDSDIVGEVVSLVRKSLRFRNPKFPQVMYFIMQIAAGVVGTLPRLQRTGGGGALGLLISGPSGTGKSSLIDRIVEHLGAYARYHYTLFGRPCMWPQLGVIRITVGDSWKDTLVAISREIDRQYGRDVLFTRERYATEPRLQHVVWTALSSGFPPCIILDEFQRLGDLNPRAAGRILNKLIDLMQDWGIPVVVVGTVAVRRLFEAFPMEMGKFSGGAGFQFQRLDESDPNTSNFIITLKELSVSVAPIQYSDEFDRYLVMHSMGVRRIMREFMRCVFYRHAVAEANGESLLADKNLLMSIAEREMLAFQRPLTAMRKFDLGFGQRYEELQAYEHFIPQEQKKQTSAQKVTEALWRAEEQLSPDEDFRLISVEDFLLLRSTIALRQYEENGERAAHIARQEGAGASLTSDVKLPAEPGLKKHRASKTSTKGLKGGQDSATANPRSNIVPLAAVRRQPAAPLQGVDPTNLPD